jgi:hypothetical protein
VIQLGGANKIKPYSLRLLWAFYFSAFASKLATPQNKKALAKSQGLILLSGGQDSNLRPPGPKPGILPG